MTLTGRTFYVSYEEKEYNDTFFLKQSSMGDIFLQKPCKFNLDPFIELISHCSSARLLISPKGRNPRIDVEIQQFHSIISITN